MPISGNMSYLRAIMAEKEGEEMISIDIEAGDVEYRDHDRWPTIRFFEAIETELPDDDDAKLDIAGMFAGIASQITKHVMEHQPVMPSMTPGCVEVIADDDETMTFRVSKVLA